MKATELMIGDYLRINRDRLCIKKGTIVEVRGIDANESFKNLIGCAICRPLDNMQYEGGIWCDYLEPIPITKEILEKNGFKVRRRYIWERRDNYCCVKVHIAPKMEIEGEIFDDPPILLQVDTSIISLNIIVEYVHELQHALRLCGIEKEIVL